MPCFESVTEKLALLWILTSFGRKKAPVAEECYLLKNIEAKAFRDTREDIGKDTESNLGSFASF